MGMWLCSDCKMPYERAWAVGIRAGILQRLIGLYKFERSRAAYKILGELLLAALPDLPLGTIVVPVPTVTSHIRERGYDHILLVANYISCLKGLQCEQLLSRITITKQRQATARQRTEQAKRAFIANGKLDGNKNYLLIDDVVTTGATIKYAAKALRAAGAKHVWVAVIARQTID
jgi:ComF family protein